MHLKVEKLNVSLYASGLNNYTVQVPAPSPVKDEEGRITRWVHSDTPPLNMTVRHGSMLKILN